MYDLTETWRGVVAWMQLPQNETQLKVSGEDNEGYDYLKGKESCDQFEKL
jgi:hypothetical protein